MLRPATWIIARNDKFPAPVSTAPPSGIQPLRANSRNGAFPALRLIADETPCGNSNHQGMMFRFQALTITSTFWSSRSPSTTWIFI